MAQETTIIATSSAGILQGQAYRVLHSVMGKSLKPHGISLTGWALLGVIAASPGVRPSYVATRLNVQRPLVTQLLRVYEDRDLLKRTAEPTDSRAKHITLTPHGYKFVEMIEQKIKRDLQGFLGDVPIGELTTYFRVLRKIATKFKN